MYFTTDTQISFNPSDRDDMDSSKRKLSWIALDSKSIAPRRIKDEQDKI